MSKLQKKFFKYFLILGVVPVIIISIITVFAMYFLHIKDVRLIEENLLNQKSIEIEKFFGNIISQIQIVVGYEDYAQPKISNQKFLLNGIVKLNPNIKSAVFVCAVAKDCKVGIETARVMTSSKDTGAVDRTNDPAFVSASGGKIYFSALEFDADLPLMTIASPVKNSKNKIIGVLIIKTDLLPIKAIIKNSVLGKTGLVYLLDSKNRIIAYSTDANNFVPSDARDVISSTKYISNFNWQIIAEWSKKEVYAIIGETTRNIVFVIMIVVILVLLLSYFVAKGVLSPIRELVRGAKIIGEGNLDYKIDIKADDELQDMVNQFNKMTGELKEIGSLTRALEKEKELSNVKGKLLTTISHQLNTPVSRIGWASETLEKNINNQEALSEAITIIKASHKNVATIIQDALFLSEIGSSKYWHKEKIKVNEIIGNILEKFKYRISEKNVRVDFNVRAGYEIEASKITIGKLFEILIDNAIIYNRQGGEIVIKIQDTRLPSALPQVNGGQARYPSRQGEAEVDKTENSPAGGEDEEKNGILVSIKDTGIGIPQDEQVYMFRNNSRKKRCCRRKCRNRNGFVYR